MAFARFWYFRHNDPRWAQAIVHAAAHADAIAQAAGMDGVTVTHTLAGLEVSPGVDGLDSFVLNAASHPYPSPALERPEVVGWDYAYCATIDPELPFDAVVVCLLLVAAEQAGPNVCRIAPLDPASCHGPELWKQVFGSPAPLLCVLPPEDD